jgi:hypothetical protein
MAPAEQQLADDAPHCSPPLQLGGFTQAPDAQYASHTTPLVHVPPEQV